jgi:hypothetical protein
VQEDTFRFRCSSAPCHGVNNPAKGMSLTTANAYDALVGVPSTERPDLMRVNPGDPETSYLWIKLGQGNQDLRDGVTMPSGESLLPQAELDNIEQWILAGAPQN